MAEVGSQRRTVGSIGGGVHLLTTGADADYVAVRFPDGAASAVTPLKGARLSSAAPTSRAAPARPPDAPPPAPRARFVDLRPVTWSQGLAWTPSALGRLQTARALFIFAP